MDKLEKQIPNIFLAYTSCLFAYSMTAETIGGLAIAASLWVLAFYIPRVFPLDKPTELQAKIDKIEKRIKELDSTVLANAEYSAKEFGTIKNVMQIQKLGR